MVLNHINHKMPIYKDCTLWEMLGVGFVAFIVMSTALSLLSLFLFGYFFIGFVVSLFSLVHVTRFLLGKLQKIKMGKPYGYYQQLFLKKLSANRLTKLYFNSPYLQRSGQWQIKRML